MFAKELHRGTSIRFQYCCLDRTRSNGLTQPSRLERHVRPPLDDAVDDAIVEDLRLAGAAVAGPDRHTSPGRNSSLVSTLP
jgi:hypothetical protein